MISHEYKLVKWNDDEFEELAITIDPEAVEDFCKMMNWDKRQFAQNTIKYPVVIEDDDETEGVEIKETEGVEIKKEKPKKEKPKLSRVINPNVAKHKKETEKIIRENIGLKNVEIVDILKEKLDIELTESRVSDFIYKNGMSDLRKRVRRKQERERRKEEKIEDWEETIHLNHNDKYACNQGCRASPEKLTKDWSKINCKNCISKFKDNPPQQITHEPERNTNGKMKRVKKQLFSENVQEYIKNNHLKYTDNELRGKIGEMFNKYYLASQIKSIRKRFGWVKKSIKSETRNYDSVGEEEGGIEDALEDF